MNTKVNLYHRPAALSIVHLQLLLLVGSIITVARIADAGSATWNINPSSSDWNTASNWTPAIVPTDTATFDISNVTDVIVSADASVGAIMFDSGASAFTLTVAPSVAFTISGPGVTNSSGVTQNLVSSIDSAGNAGSVNLSGNATVDGSTSFTTAANATGEVAWGSSVSFTDGASAGNGVFYNNGAATSGSLGGLTIFYGRSTASNGTFVSDGGSVSGGQGGSTYFVEYSSAGSAIITAGGGTVSGAGGGYITFEGYTSLGNATLIAMGGLNGGGGGAVSFGGYQAAHVTNNARVELFGNGFIDLGGAVVRGISLGSLEGTGDVFLRSTIDSRV